MTTDKVTAEQIEAGYAAYLSLGSFYPSDGESKRSKRIVAAYLAMRALEPSPKDEGMREVWRPISEGKPGVRYMGAFLSPLRKDVWEFVGPGRVEDGVFKNYLGSWGIKKIFPLPPIAALAALPIPAPDGDTNDQ